MDSFNQALASGLSMGLRMQELRSQQALQRLREQQMAQELAFKLEAHDMEVQRRADMTKALARVQTATSPTIPLQLPRTEGMSPMILPPGSDGMPQAEGMAPPLGVPETVEVPNPNAMPLEDALGTYVLPVIFQHDRTGREGFDALANIARMKQERESNDFQPRAEPITMPDGTVMQGVRTSRNTWTPTSTGEPEVRSINGRSFRRNRFGDWVPMSATAEEIGDRQTAQKFLAKSLDLDPSQVKMDEEGNAVITPEVWAKLSQAGSVTTGTRGKMEQTILATQTSSGAARSALQTIEETPEALGLPGMFRELIETGKGLAGMQNDPVVSKARDRLRQDFIRLAEDLKVDVGNLTQYERNKLEEAGDPTRWDQYLARTKPKMQALLDAASAKELRLTRQLGRDISNDLIGRVPVSEVQGLYDSNILTDAELLRLVRLRRITAAHAREVRDRKPKG